MSERAPKPGFIMSKGQRNEADRALDTSYLAEHYRQVASGLYRWEGLPEGCPKDFIEATALWFSPGVGAKPVKGIGNVLAPIRPSTVSVYGIPYDWIPVAVRGMLPMRKNDDFFRPSNYPCMWNEIPREDAIEPFIRIMSRAMRVLDVNILGLSQPVMISGLPNAPMDGLILKSELADGELYIPTASRNGVDAQVLDLKAQDHTQNLVSTIDWCDARILEILASSNGVEKASGITTMETVSGVQSVLQQIEVGLDKRLEWCEKVNAELGMSLTVKPGKGVESLLAGKPSEQNAPEPSQEDEDDRERLPLRRIPMPEVGRRRRAHRQDGSHA